MIRKLKLIFVTALVFVFTCMLSSCKIDSVSQYSEEKDDATVTNQPKGAINLNDFVPEFTVDNTTPLNNLLTKEYGIQELKDFFGPLPLHERLLYGKAHATSDLRIKSVNEKYLIECVRHVDNRGHYSVYKVSEGGYFYVFWTTTFSKGTELNQKPDGAVVHFTAYLTSLPKLSDFDSIDVDKSTAEDVSMIDPAFQLYTFLSSRLPSYSLLEDGSVLEICYDFNSSPESRKDLIVKSKRIISKELSPSSLSLVFLEDLP